MKDYPAFATVDDNIGNGFQLSGNTSVASNSVKQLPDTTSLKSCILIYVFIPFIVNSKSHRGFTLDCFSTAKPEMDMKVAGLNFAEITAL